MPIGSPQFSATGFRRFLDKLTTHGLEYFGIYLGTYRAIVLDNEDQNSPGSPDPQGRIVVRVPSVGDAQEAERIAYPITPFAGGNYGMKFIPPVDSQVYVVFERGRLDAPLWFGGWWAQSEIPEDLQSVDSHGIITPGGHQLIFDEQDGSEFIRLRHLDEETLIELDFDGNIFITNKSGKKVNIGDGAETANEPAALGNTLKGLIEELIDAINALTVPTPVGPSGTPTNAAVFSSIKSRLQTILSETINVK